MADKQIIIDDVDVSGCDFLVKENDYCSYSGEYRAYKGQCGCSDDEMCKDHPNCFYKKALKQLKLKEQEYDKLKKELMKKNEIITFYMKKDEINALFNTPIDGQSNSHCEICKYKQTLEELKRKIIKIFACLIKANRANKILDTLWVDNITTLWDYIALTLGIEGDQIQIEEQVLQNERGAK